MAADKARGSAFQDLALCQVRSMPGAACTWSQSPQTLPPLPVSKEHRQAERVVCHFLSFYRFPPPPTSPRCHPAKRQRGSGGRSKPQRSGCGGSHQRRIRTRGPRSVPHPHLNHLLLSKKATVALDHEDCIARARHYKVQAAAAHLLKLQGALKLSRGKEWGSRDPRRPSPHRGVDERLAIHPTHTHACDRL